MGLQLKQPRGPAGPGPGRSLLFLPRWGPRCCRALPSAWGPPRLPGGQRTGGVVVGAVGPEATLVTAWNGGGGGASPTCGRFLTTESSGGAGLELRAPQLGVGDLG